MHCYAAVLWSLQGYVNTTLQNKQNMSPFCLAFGFCSWSCFFKASASTKKRSMDRSPRSAAMVRGVFPGVEAAKLFSGLVFVGGWFLR